jgi:hypothetical protein
MPPTPGGVEGPAHWLRVPAHQPLRPLRMFHIGVSPFLVMVVELIGGGRSDVAALKLKCN